MVWEPEVFPQKNSTSKALLNGKCGALNTCIYFIVVLLYSTCQAVHQTQSFTRSVYVVCTLIKDLKNNTGLFYSYDGGENKYKWHFCLKASYAWASIVFYWGKGVSFERNCGAASVGVWQDNLTLSTGLIMWIGHRKEIWELTFRALALRRSDSRNYGLCVVYIQKYGATLLVGAWQREKQQIKLVEWNAFVHTVSADLKNNFLF